MARTGGKGPGKKKLVRIHKPTLAFNQVIQIRLSELDEYKGLGFQLYIPDGDYCAHCGAQDHLQLVEYVEFWDEPIILAGLFPTDMICKDCAYVLTQEPKKEPETETVIAQ